MKKIDVFIDNKQDIHIMRITKKVKQLFKMKSRNPYIMCDLRRCMFLSRVIVETVRKVEIRWQEYEDTQKDSELAKHLQNNPTHSFTWKVLLPALSNRRISQNMEASMITRPPPNECVGSKKL